MGTIARFEEIEAWQSGRQLANLIYTLSDEGRFARDFGLRDQMRRAAVSVMANIAEGFDRKSHKEFANFLNVAYASATEVKSHLYVALDQEYITQQQFDKAYTQCVDTAKMILGFMQYLRGNKVKANA